MISHIEFSTTDAPAFSAAFPVAGAVTVRVDTLSADVEAAVGARAEVRLEMSDAKRKSAELRSEGPGELRAYFDGSSRLESGHLRLLLPPGTRLEVSTASGSLNVSGVGGDVRLHSASGDAQLHDARRIDIDTASGELSIGSFSGPARISTASGDVHVQRGSTPISSFDFKSASGELKLDGLCAKDCRLNIETVSGDIELHTAAGSSYNARYHTMSGDLDGPAELRKQPGADDDDDAIPPKDRSFRRGDGQGAIQVTTVSGDLSIGPN
jgi:hypothetical protein